MNTTPKTTYSLTTGAKVMWRGIKIMALKKPLLFVWVNFFSTWMVGGAGLMLYWGSTSILPLVCVLTPFVSIPWAFMVTSKYGFSRLLSLPRAFPWLPATGIAVVEYLDGSFAGQPDGYQTFLVGFLLVNGVCTLIDFVDIARWLSGDRAEHPDTGYLSGAH